MTRTLHVKHLSSVSTRRIEWVYQDRIPLRTGTIVAAPGGIGKSTILSDVIARATRGELPGTFQGQPINVGVISPEDDIESILVPRLLAANADLSRVHSLAEMAVEGEKKRWTTLPNIGDDLNAIGEAIEQEGIKLLLVDPLVSIMTGNSISQSDVRRNFDPLSSLASELEFALLAVAHFGKSGDKAGDRLSGSHAFRDITRSLIVAAIDEETEYRILTVEKSNYSREKPSDAYRIDSVPVVLDDGFTEEVGRAVLVGRSDITVQQIMDREHSLSNLSGDSQKLIEAVNYFPNGGSAAEIAARAGVSGDIAARYLNRAVERGDIAKLSRGKFGPLSSVQPVPSVQNASQTGHVGHIRHISSRDTCPICGTELHPTLIAAGATTHPGCAA